MDEHKLLAGLVDHRTKRRSDSTVKLADSISSLMNGRISPQQERYMAAADALDQVVPASFRSRCKIAEIAGNTLRLKVNSPVYLYQLKVCEEALLEQLKKNRAIAKINKILIAVG